MATRPTVSIVVPLRDDHKYIEGCLNSLLAQTYPADKLEIIVVDGLSQDGSADISRRVLQNVENAVVLDNPAKTTPVGRNIGVADAGGDYVAIIDSHNTVAEDYIAKAILLLEARPEIACVGGTRLAKGRGYVGRAIASIFSSPLGVGWAKYAVSHREQLADTVQFPVYRRSVFERLGDFDERLVRNQDNEFNHRLWSAGEKILFSPELVGEYFVRENLRDLAKQSFANGFWNIRSLRLVGWSLAPRHLTPLAFVSVLFIAIAAAPLSVWPLAAMITPYLLVVSVFSIVGAAQSGAALLPLLPFVFMARHFSYGLGSLAGLVEWIWPGSRVDRFAAK